MPCRHAWSWLKRGRNSRTLGRSADSGECGLPSGVERCKRFIPPYDKAVEEVIQSAVKEHCAGLIVIGRGHLPEQQDLFHSRVYWIVRRSLSSPVPVPQMSRPARNREAG